MNLGGIEQIGPQEAQERVAAGAVMLDVREADERQSAHIPGSAFVPMSQIQDRLDEVPKGVPIVVQCAKGGRSQQVAAWLARQGYEVCNLAGGIGAWAHVGLPISQP